jgi:hypothetical protein
MTQMDGLYLMNNSLSGPLPPSWSSMSSIQDLYLQHNKLTGPLPPEWSNMTQVPGPEQQQSHGHRARKLGSDDEIGRSLSRGKPPAIAVFRRVGNAVHDRSCNDFSHFMQVVPVAGRVGRRGLRGQEQHAV